MHRQDTQGEEKSDVCLPTSHVSSSMLCRLIAVGGGQKCLSFAMSFAFADQIPRTCGVLRHVTQPSSLVRC